MLPFSHPLLFAMPAALVLAVSCSKQVDPGALVHSEGGIASSTASDGAGDGDGEDVGDGDGEHVGDGDGGDGDAGGDGEPGGDGDAGGDGNPGGDGDEAGDDDDGETGAGGGDGTADCDGKVYQCGDGVDNDGDGVRDGNDPECTSVCDDDESSFATGIPGDNVDCKQDCFFDGDSGSGNDGCDWDLKCDPANPGAGTKCAYTGGQGCDEVSGPSEECLASCLWRVPNGCDCFGCCTVFTPEGSVDVFLGSGGDCSLDNLDACNSCTKNDDCDNPCEPELCEVCIGDVIYPDDCDDEDTPGDGGDGDGGDDDGGDGDGGDGDGGDDDDDPPTGCPEGVEPCDTQEDCSDDQAFCFQGCCRLPPVE